MCGVALSLYRWFLSPSPFRPLRRFALPWNDFDLYHEIPIRTRHLFFIAIAITRTSDYNIFRFLCRRLEASILVGAFKFSFRCATRNLGAARRMHMMHHVSILHCGPELSYLSPSFLLWRELAGVPVDESEQMNYAKLQPGEIQAPTANATRDLLSAIGGPWL